MKRYKKLNSPLREMFEPRFCNLITKSVCNEVQHMLENIHTWRLWETLTELSAKGLQRCVLNEEV